MPFDRAYAALVNIEYIDLAARFLEGFTYETFCDDLKTFYAVTRALEIISEASRRLPNELKDLFKEWLATHYPLKAEHVMSIIRQSRDGKEYDSAFGSRMRGTGKFAELIAQRFHLATKRLNLGFGSRMR